MKLLAVATLAAIASYTDAAKVWLKLGQGLCARALPDGSLEAVRYQDRYNSAIGEYEDLMPEADYIGWTREGGGDWSSPDSRERCMRDCEEDSTCVSFVRHAWDGECIKYRVPWAGVQYIEGYSEAWECWQQVEESELPQNQATVPVPKKAIAQWKLWTLNSHIIHIHTRERHETSCGTYSGPDSDFVKLDKILDIEVQQREPEGWSYSSGIDDTETNKFLMVYRPKKKWKSRGDFADMLDRRGSDTNGLIDSYAVCSVGSSNVNVNCPDFRLPTRFLTRYQLTDNIVITIIDEFDQVEPVTTSDQFKTQDTCGVDRTSNSVNAYKAPLYTYYLDLPTTPAIPSGPAATLDGLVPGCTWTSTDDGLVCNKDGKSYRYYQSC